MLDSLRVKDELGLVIGRYVCCSTVPLAADTDASRYIGESGVLTEDLSSLEHAGVPDITAPRARVEAIWSTLLSMPLLVETSRSLPSLVRRLINRSGKLDWIGEYPDLMLPDDLVKSLGLLEEDSTDEVDSSIELYSFLKSSIIES